MLQRREGRGPVEPGSCGAVFVAPSRDWSVSVPDTTADTGSSTTGDTVSAVTVGLQISWLSAAGKLVDDAAAADLADALAEQRAVGRRFVWLDLSRVSVLDRVSFDVLVEAHHRFLAAGGALVLTGVSPRIARLLESAGQGETLFATATQSARRALPAQ